MCVVAGHIHTVEGDCQVLFSPAFFIPDDNFIKLIFGVKLLVLG